MKRRVIQRRVVVFLLLLLAGGAIMNVAVAWLGQMAPRTPSRMSPFVKETTPIEGYAVEQLCYEQSFWSSIDYVPLILNPKINGKHPHLRVIEQGWPMRCLSCRGAWRARDFEWDCALVYTRFVGPVSYDVPLADAVIWPGFAINTIFYAAILWGGWVLFFVQGKLKRTLRRRRGQCPACAYPVGTSPVCTECGNQIPVSTVART